jgi:hypothetical protein
MRTLTLEATETEPGAPTRRAKAEPDDEDARATRAIQEQLQRERLLRRRRQGAPKAFFR